ncbi:MULTISPECIES: GNAT family N-acetyltransferase [unclassified Streptomyces]|uniref:GNAT family N-acetyltransferase n=1 Tax=unclassified Streptomyces TaxID=2593676 RepID=UPI0016617F32|nr:MULTISPECIES: GNAT family N-acetyltransferase [unclassified Streptomyces]MBD0711547.1 GNAT family N-acetyltransferase [Streptomyces sp. CBMA291]MBD0716551.1 GNAT family N-acetyltransferase [Streptomyces sp. CBMA370]
MASVSSGSLSVSPATVQDWELVLSWAADEGWNPGHSDARAFFAQDPDGFFLGRLDGEPVSAISVVTYDDAYAFLGFYLVRPELRGLGHGLATWRAALAHAGGRSVGLDGVPAQQDNYRRSGFATAYRTARYVGEVPAPDRPAAGVVPAERVDPAALAAYDNACHHADRPRFLAAWLAAPGHRALARVTDGRLTGYGVVRAAQDEARIGPLFADTPGDAAVLLDALAAEARALGSARIAVDMPESNPAAARLAEERGLLPTFETARMYTGPVRPVARERVFGVTTLELG